MAVYTIFADKAPKRLAEALPEAVPDRFSWFAFLLPPLFLLGHGLWLALVGFVLAAVAIGASGLWLGADAAFWLYVLLALFIGLEAGALRRGKLTRRRRWQAERVAGTEDDAVLAWLTGRAT